jgi:hypothetical protein
LNSKDLERKILLSGAFSEILAKTDRRSSGFLAVLPNLPTTIESFESHSPVDRLEMDRSDEIEAEAA